MRVAAHWLHQRQISSHHRVQYDVLAIQFGSGVPEYMLFEDVSL
jgi:hypothetical protein